jgi:hypothetical protein
VDEHNRCHNNLRISRYTDPADMLKLASMGSRLFLIVGSQCDELTHLPFVDELAENLHGALQAGQWTPAGGDDGLLMNPKTADLKAAVESAFTAANKARSTLLIAFIGHGVARGSHDFYLMTTDAPGQSPNSDKAFHLTQFIRERLADFPSVDGLVFLVDACEAGEGVRGAATRWTDVLADNKGRMELLVASGKRKAYDGCFTRSILEVFQSGLATRGENLLCGDLLPHISKCKGRQQHFAYSGAILISGDPGLWLVPNAARYPDAVKGRPAAGLLDELTSRVILTSAVRQDLTAIDDARRARLRLVVGDEGSGKSTLLALLVRPKIVDTLHVPDSYIKAAVFLDASSTLETLANEISLQLEVSLPGFADASSVAEALAQPDLNGLGVWDTKLLLPLTLVHRPGLTVPLIIDGLDQPEPGARDVILAALHHMTHTLPSEIVGHVRVIAGMRGGQGVDTLNAVAHAHRIEIEAPTIGDITAAVTGSVAARVADGRSSASEESIAGGWLTARLVRDIADNAGTLEMIGELDELVTLRARLGVADDPVAVTVLGLIAAAGVGPVLPIRLLASAITPGKAAPLSSVRDAATRLGVLTSRGNPGSGQETLGIGHLSFLHPITVYLTEKNYLLAQAHRALISAVHGRPDPTEPVGTESLPKAIASYWRSAGPRHYLEGKLPGLAVKYLETLDSYRAAENRDRWATWVPSAIAALGLDDPAILAARYKLAYWRAAAGDPIGAIGDLEPLLADQTRLLGADHIDTLTTRNDLASSHGHVGEVSRAIEEFESLLIDQERALGHDHYSTLTTRNNLAYWRGEAGDVQGATREFEALLPMLERVRGSDHSEAFTVRNNLADSRGAVGDVPQAIADLEALLDDRLRVNGPDHADTLVTRGNLAYWRGEGGDVPQAIADLEALLEDRIRLLGPDDPDTLNTRRHLSDLQGQAGNITRAIADLEELLVDTIRVHRARHPDAMKVQNALAHWRSQNR